MNKISFIIEFDEVSKTQEEQLTEFIEKTGIKFHVLESDNDLKKYKKYKEVIDRAIDLIEKSVITDIGIDSNNNIIHYHQLTEDETSELLDVLKEVE